jgi:hypothetical protein
MWKKLWTEAKTWGWWAAEQLSVLFMPAPTIKVEGQDQLQPCPTCWWYRGVALGFVLGAFLMFLIRS